MKSNTYTWKNKNNEKPIKSKNSRNKFLIRIERVWGSILFNDVVTNLKHHVGPFRHHFACYDSFFGHVRCHKRSTLGLLLCFELQNRAAVVHIVKMAENNLGLPRTNLEKHEISTASGFKNSIHFDTSIFK